MPNVSLTCSEGREHGHFADRETVRNGVANSGGRANAYRRLFMAVKSLIRGMDEKVAEQLRNVASLPGIVRAAYAMPVHIGDMVFRSAGLVLSMRMMAA